MKNFQPLNVEQHKNLGYTEKYGSSYGHQVGAVMILPNEFAKAQREYPILFRKDSETGRFLPVVLLGFEEHENLLLDENSNWSTRYIPLAVKQGPFIIGLQQQETEQRLVVYVDLNDSRIQPNVTPALFKDDGTSSTTLNDVRDVLLARHKGSELLEPMIEAFLKYDLLERVRLEIDLGHGTTIKFDAGYTVHIEKLTALENDAVVELHRSGFLSLAYNVADSVNNIQRLIDIKNAKTK
ncbi:SapC family protein [Cellvibrio mixtus]|uniref:SapC family protein n=1 Tax=Cellvibrio mixtus TaxID=39650 RepID=UPI000586B76D|nr:SapC family protein [Cellvibrio mixtus]